MNIVDKVCGYTIYKLPNGSFIAQSSTTEEPIFLSSSTVNGCKQEVIEIVHKQARKIGWHDR